MKGRREKEKGIGFWISGYCPPSPFLEENKITP